MFTVLIAEKEHIDAIRQENKLFFEPFLENKELAFCPWNPAGQSLYDSVPGLADAVGRHKKWRAVIINNANDAYLSKQNPFDVVDYSAVSALRSPQRQPEEKEPWDAWEQQWVSYFENLTREKEAAYRSAMEFPLQKLTTWLCFRPEDYILNDVQEKQDAHDWAMERLGADQVKPSVRLEHLERGQYKWELRVKEQIRREFVDRCYLNNAYPSEVHCICLRTADNGFFDPDTYWSALGERDYSAFADRNMYFDKMRFLVFDLLPKTHYDFRNDYIRFLASVLIFISNPVPGSAMQARHLYQLEVDTDDTPLCTMVTSYDRKLAATAEVIETEMERIRSEIPGKLTDKAAQAMFCTPQDVTVQMDESCDPDKVAVDNDYGLFSDYPENERHKWNRDSGESDKALQYIIKQQERSVRKSVVQLGIYSEVSDVNVSRLTPFQIDDVREYTDAAEDEMVASTPEDISDMSQYKQRLEEEKEKVKKAIDRRMTRKTTLCLMMVCLGLYLACFVPFLLSNNHSPKTVTTAVILVGVLLGTLAAVMFISLFFLRSSVRKAVKGYNETVQEVMSQIQGSMKQFSNYLSASCNVRRGSAVQNYARQNLDVYTKSLRIRKKHLEDIRKKRAYLAEDYRDYFGDRTYCDETMTRPYEYDFDQRVEYPYPAPFLAGDFRQIEFISSGNLVTVPFSFVTRMLVRLEGIYEKQ